MARRAKRASKPNPRAERNLYVTEKDDNLIKVSFLKKEKKKKVEIIPRNISQEIYVEKLEDESQYVVFAIGPAGTGKTLLATLYAIKELKAGRIERIVITRPNVASDDQDIGFLPGGIIEKMSPWSKPILDIFGEFYSKKEIEYLLEESVLELSPLAFMRGRTFKNCIVIGDELQNASPEQVKMLLTRIGDNCRIVITGDPNQHDRKLGVNGISDAVSKLTGIEGISITQFYNGDIERHPIISDILRNYGE